MLEMPLTTRKAVGTLGHGKIVTRQVWRRSIGVSVAEEDDQASCEIAMQVVFVQIARPYQGDSQE